MPGRLRTGCDFYPRPPRGGPPSLAGPPELEKQFLSTPSARRATIDRGAVIKYGVFLSTPSARRATPCSFSPGQSTGNFYPRPPRGGRRKSAPHGSLPTRFLSTPSARRATCRFSADCGVLRNFYPRPPRGGRRAVNALLSPFKPISIHALREEGDHTTTKQEDKPYFYPRPPRGGRLLNEV